MEDLLRKIAEAGLENPAWYDLIDALIADEITLPDLLRAKNEDRLHELRRELAEPLLENAIAEYRVTGPNYDTENGLRVLREMVEREFGLDARLSVLRSGKNITKLCARAKREGGRNNGPMAHNSVRRTILLSASKLLRFHVGNAERNRIFADVDFPREQDTRDVWLSGTGIRKLLDSCEPWFMPFVLIALSTGADRSPLLRMTVRDVTINEDETSGVYSGKAYLRDTKTEARPRSVPLVDPVCRALMPHLEGKSPDNPVFDGPPDDTKERSDPLTAAQVRYWFEKARKKAGMDHLRFKDLRRTWAVNADEAGLSLGQLKGGLGHSEDETTVRYTHRQLALEHEAAVRVAQQMGLVD